MTRDVRGSGVRQVTTGLLLMAAGVLLLLDQQGLVEIGSLGRWWPLVLVGLGLWKITAPPGERDAGGGSMLIVVGAWVLACTHHWMGLTFRNSWPLVFVGIGVKMVVRALVPSGPRDGRLASRFGTAADAAGGRDPAAGKEQGHA